MPLERNLDLHWIFRNIVIIIVFHFRFNFGAIYGYKFMWCKINVFFPFVWFICLICATENLMLKKKRQKCRQCLYLNPTCDSCVAFKIHETTWNSSSFYCSAGNKAAVWKMWQLVPKNKIRNRFSNETRSLLHFENQQHAVNLSATSYACFICR